MRQLLLTFFALLASVCANAQEVVTVDGIRYYLGIIPSKNNAPYAEIAGNDDYYGEAVIQDKIVWQNKTYPVVGFRRGSFSGCENLTSVVLPDGIEKIGDSAFEYCKNLKTVYIGSGIKIINYHIFEGCSNLRDIYLKAVKCPQIPLGAFDKDVPCDRITLHVPNDVVDMYKGMIPWNKFKIVGM